MSENIKQVERQLYILSLLSWYPEGITVKELHRKLSFEGINVSQRTVRRDLDNLTLANFPLFEEKKGNTIYYKVRKFKLPDACFTFSELVALYFLKELLEPISFLPVAKNAHRFIYEIIENLPRLNQKFIINLQDHFIIEQTLLNPQEKTSRLILETLSKAIIEHKVISATYYSFSSNTLTEREIEPYFITINNRHYYLVGYCHLRNEVRDFRVSRFQKVAITDISYTQKKSFSYQDYILPGQNLLLSLIMLLASTKRKLLYISRMLKAETGLRKKLTKPSRPATLPATKMVQYALTPKSPGKKWPLSLAAS